MPAPITDLFASAKDVPSATACVAPRPAEPSRAPVAAPRAGTASPSPLWLSLYFPDLAIEVFETGTEEPVAVLASGSRTSVILIGSPAARAAGVREGMPANAALALLPTLRVLARDERREREALVRLAHRALRFSSRVALGPGHAVLAEIGSSIGCFGGIRSLWRQVLDELGTLGHACVPACAPTVRAALCLARVGRREVVEHLADVPAQLAGLPLGALGWPPPTLRLLRAMGVRSIGECARLPREGLARRIGAPLLRELDELFGRVPEVLPAWRPAEDFRETVELPAEAADHALLCQALAAALRRLGTLLQARQAAVPALWIHCLHRRHPPTVLRVGLLEPCTEVAELQDLAALRLDQLRLPGSVTALELRAALVPRAPVSAELLGPSRHEQRAFLRLVERLRTRLGFAAVHAVRRVPEHPPERAWGVVTGIGRRMDPPAAGLAAHLPERPLWLLPAPLPISDAGGKPGFQGGLRLCRGPERIETGWWTGEDVRRDYYVASNPRGRVLWIFRDRGEGRWYLHGLYG